MKKGRGFPLRPIRARDSFKCPAEFDESQLLNSS